jgi:hypothetical protein
MPGPTDLFKNTSLKKRRGTKRGTPYEKMATEYRQARDKAYYGSLGGASPVRRIDPKTGKVVAVIDPQTGLPLRPGIKRVRARGDPIKKLMQMGGSPKSKSKTTEVRYTTFTV